METADFVTLLQSVRDHLTIAIHNAERGDGQAAVAETEKAVLELEQAVEELRS